ncbi:MAG: FHA domain-containing protein [Gemmataceae bacterium]|nr:FHA domain-containing protein [Gemmataceae bacterium]
MSEKRVIIGHAPHGAQGPHLDLPVGFVPLELRIEAENASIEVSCPIAMVGRHTDADLRFAFADVSRRHCRLAFVNGQWRVYDLKSLNGVFVNNVRTDEATLYAGDMLRIGCLTALVVAATPLKVANDKLRQIADVWPGN